MARLRINWRTMTDVAPQAVTTGDRAEDATNTSRFADRPMMVLVTHRDPTDKMMNRLDAVVFANEQFALGTKFFDTIRISEADASRDRVLAKAGRGVPRLVFLTREYKVAKVLSGRGISAGKGLKAMKLLSKKSYVNNFSKMVKGYIKLLNKLDQLEGTKRRLADTRSRLSRKPDRSKAKKLERDMKEYEKDVVKWAEQEKKLLEMKPREKKRTRA